MFDGGYVLKALANSCLAVIHVIFATLCAAFHDGKDPGQKLRHLPATTVPLKDKTNIERNLGVRSSK